MTTPLTISPITRRRFILGKQGLWPGRRWSGRAGIRDAFPSISMVQIDPLNVLARNHDITLWGRVDGYQNADLNALLYEERAFFDWGGTVFIFPMSALPNWRLAMDRKIHQPRPKTFFAEHGATVEAVRQALRERGPLGSRDLDGVTLGGSTGFRSTKSTAKALYYLWIAGELMTHSRRGLFERIYDFTENVAPADLQYRAEPDAAEHYFAINALNWVGMTTQRGWRGTFAEDIYRKVSPQESNEWIKKLTASGDFTEIAVTGAKDPYYILSADLPLLESVHQGDIPPAWQPISTTTDDEAVFLAPLDIVSARGRAKTLFDFEYIWEVYKPVEKRKYGYYTMPILYGDTLVGRMDAARVKTTLVIKGMWLDVPANKPLLMAIARGLQRMGQWLGTAEIDLTAITDSALRDGLKKTGQV